MSRYSNRYNNDNYINKRDRGRRRYHPSNDNNSGPSRFNNYESSRRGDWSPPRRSRFTNAPPDGPPKGSNDIPSPPPPPPPQQPYSFDEGEYSGHPDGYYPQPQYQQQMHPPPDLHPGQQVIPQPQMGRRRKSSQAKEANRLKVNKFVDGVIGRIKTVGIFDELRRECLSDVDTKPTFMNLHSKVITTADTFLKGQTWTPNYPKAKMRDLFRKKIEDSPYFEKGLDSIVDQALGSKMESVFIPIVQAEVFSFMGFDKEEYERNQKELTSADKLLEDKLSPVPMEEDIDEEPTPFPPPPPSSGGSGVSLTFPPLPPTEPPPPPPDPEEMTYMAHTPPPPQEPYPPGEEDEEDEALGMSSQEMVESDSEEESPMFEKIGDVSPPRPVLLENSEQILRELQKEALLNSNIITPIFVPRIEEEKLAESGDEENLDFLEKETPEILDKEKAEVSDEEKAEIVHEKLSKIVDKEKLDLGDEKLSDLADGPEIVDEKLPEIVDEKKPEIVEEKLLEIVDEKKPEIVDDKLPELVDEKKPEIVDDKLSELVDEKKPEIVEEKLPEIVEEKLPEIVDEKLSETDEKLPEIVDEKLPEIVDGKLSDIEDDKLPEIVDEKLPELMDEKLPDLIDEKLSDIEDDPLPRVEDMPVLFIEDPPFPKQIPRIEDKPMLSVCTVPTLPPNHVKYFNPDPVVSTKLLYFKMLNGQPELSVLNP